MIINKIFFLDYFLMILFIALSGVPYLVSPILKILQFSLLFLIFILRRKTINKSFLLFFTILFVLTLLQGLDFNFFPVMTNIGFYILVLNAYLLVKILEDKFMSYYIIVMYYVAIVSLFFFLPILLVPAIGYFLVDSIVPLFNSFNFAHSLQPTIIIYNFADIDSFRNNGPYWEPGTFAGYLIIAFMFNVITEKKIIEKKNIVFFIAIITTTSTTAFLAMFVFLSFIYYKQIKNFIFKSVAVTGIIVIGVVAYTTLDFLGKKIESRLEAFHSKNILETRNSGRFVSVLRDMQDFKGHEFTGTGRHKKTRYNASSAPTHRLIIRSNGVSDVIVKNGIIFFIIIIYFLYKSVCAYVSIHNIQEKGKMTCVGISLVLILLLWSEVYFNYPVYWSLLFLWYAYDGKGKLKPL